MTAGWKNRMSTEADKSAAPVEVTCSFCGKPRTEVDQIVCGPTPAIAICNECVDLCREIMDEQAR